MYQLVDSYSASARCRPVPGGGGGGSGGSNEPPQLGC